MIENLEKTQALLETWDAPEVLEWAFDSFGSRVQMASGFGVEGMVLIDIAARINPDLQVFTIDTGFLFPETYELIERVEKRYRIQVERVRTRLTPQDQEEAYGPALWSVNPDQCCALRKVEPLRESLRPFAHGSPPFAATRLNSARAPKRLSGTANSGWSRSTPSSTGPRRTFGTTSTLIMFLTIRCTISITPVSDARIARGRWRQGMIPARVVGQALRRPNAVCICPTTCRHPRWFS